MLTHKIKIRRKGQMTLPAEVRRDLGVEAGDIIYLQKVIGRYQISTREEIADPAAGALARYGDPMNPVSIEEMDQAVRDAILEKWDRFVRETEANTET